MTRLKVQVLLSIISFVSLSFSQEDGKTRSDTNYVVIDKQINIKEIIRFGGRGGDVKGENAKIEVPENNGVFDSSLTSLSSLMTKAHNAANLKNLKGMLPLSGLQWLDKAENNTGSAIVCGPKGAHLNISWVPKVIDPQKSVMIYFDVTNPIDFNKGLVHLDVYMEGSPDPIFSLDQDVACNDLKHVAPFIGCPLKKGDRHVYSFRYSDLNRVPEGSYTVVAKIFSYEKNPPPLFACLNITLQIVPSKRVFVNPSSEIVGHL